MKSKRNKNSNPVFPEINYDYWSKRPSWEDRSSIPGMITILKNQKLIDHSTTAGNITERIKAAIAQYLNDRKNSEALKLAFIYIQAWGGLSARIYTPQIITNWDISSFLKIIKNFKETSINLNRLRSSIFLRKILIFLMSCSI